MSGISLIVILVGILSATFIVGSAKKRGMLSVIWGVFAFFFALPTWIIFLIVRKPIKRDKPDIDSFSKPEILD